MSLQAFKETLKPCSNSSSSSTSIEAHTKTFTSNYKFDSSISRKPPKTSLSQQLLRLQDPLTPPPIEPRIQPKTSSQDHKGGDFEDDDEDEEEEEEEEVFLRPKVSQFQFDHTGPYEPLVLTSEREIPIIQVIIWLPSSII